MGNESNYKKILNKEYRECFGKKLLLITKEKDGLFRLKEGGFVEVAFNKDGDVSIFEITNRHRIRKPNFLLRELGQNYLSLKDHSASVMLQHLVLPEMEVERIFNNVRYKYLQILLFSNFKNPNDYISASYNKAFQSLAGIAVYQGNTKTRKPNDAFWSEASFTASAKEKINFSKEREEIGAILSYMRHFCDDDFNRIYAELIAIKPGFHEIWVHKDYFDKILSGSGLRINIFKAIRNAEPISGEKLHSLPHEINSQNYFSYAPCAITEGPFVFRKNISVLYFNEIQKIHSKNELDRLNEKFHIRNYYHENISSVERLDEFLKSTEKFQYFLT